MLKTNSFTYSIATQQLTEKTAGVHEAVFTFDALPQSEYFVQCTMFILTQTGLVGAPYIINLVASDFSSDRTYNAGSTLQTNQLCLASIPNNVNSGCNLLSGEGAVFRVRDMNLQKRVRFTLTGGTLYSNRLGRIEWKASS